MAPAFELVVSGFRPGRRFRWEVIEIRELLTLEDAEDELVWFALCTETEAADHVYGIRKIGEKHPEIWGTNRWIRHHYGAE